MIATALRCIAVVAMLVLCAATGAPKYSGAGAVQRNAVFYETRPRFEWEPHGTQSRIVLWRLAKETAGSDQQRVALYDLQHYTERAWQPPADLEFDTRYELYIYDDQLQIVSSVGFAIGYEAPRALGVLGRAGAKLRNLSPEIRIATFAYHDVWLSFEIAATAAFAPVLDSGFVAQDGNVQRVKGVDYVGWTVGRVLETAKTYHWRVRAYYFPKTALAAGQRPDPRAAIGRSELVGSFVIGEGSEAELLANVTQVTRDDREAWSPSISRKHALAYASQLPDGGAQIRIATATLRGGEPVFDTGREELTRSLKGSRDLRPQWDLDGDGVFFDSNRSQQTSNIWFKKRVAPGYTQLTFHDVDAWAPSLSKDGSKIAYQVRTKDPSGWSIWIVDRDGRSATELGPGEQPAFSPDGRRIAFALRDASGNRQLWMMDASGSGRVQLTKDADNFAPAWHPSSKRLAFVSDRSDNHDLWMMEIDGGKTVQLTTYFGDDTTPKFTADGRYLLFSSNRGGEVHHIWMGEIAQ